METKEVALHPNQYEAINFSTQYGAAIAGVRGGKTFVGAYWAAKMIAECKGHGIIAGPTYKVLQQATLPTFFEQFPSYRKFFKEQKSIIELPDGRNIYVRSMDNPLTAEGITADWAWGDEAGLYPMLAWTVLRSRTSLKRGKIFLTTTPYNLGWLYQDFYLPWKEGKDADLSVFSWASVDNPHFPPDFYEKEKTRLRPEEFKRRYEGGFTRMEGLVYDLKQWHQIDPLTVTADITLGGIDWGFTNPAALVVVKIHDGAYYIVDEWYETGKTTPEIIEQCIKMQKQWGVNRWYADSANPEKVQEASTNTGLYVIPYEKKKDAISHGISTIRSYMNENRFFVFKPLKHTIAEFESYHYPEHVDGKSPKEDPVAENNHLLDAIRYAIHGYQPARRVPIPVVNTNTSVRRLLDNQSTSNANATSYK